jgi:hypothetical protein
MKMAAMAPVAAIAGVVATKTTMMMTMTDD